MRLACSKCMTYLFETVYYSGLKRTLFQDILYFKRQSCFKPLSFAVNLNNQKLEKFLKSVNAENLQTQFKMDLDKQNYILLEEKENLEDNILQLQTMKENEVKAKGGNEMIKLIDDDISQYTAKLKDVYGKLLECLLPPEDFEDCNDIVIEISAGVGGLEAMLFTSELCEMYCGYLKYKGWEHFIAEYYESELGGVRQCSLLVTGPGAYATLRHEAGVHRVQRVPATERSGRMHTSTATVAVLPQPSDVEVNLKDSELKIETKRASGAGGQHVNTTDSAVRITHIPTGIVVECQTDRNQHKNKTSALKRLQSKLFERELAQQNSSIKSQRKQQVGTSSRSEKIRTYNYRDDRVSDHRLSENIHNLRQFMAGGEPLEKLLSQIDEWHYNQRVQMFVDSLPP